MKHLRGGAPTACIDAPQGIGPARNFQYLCCVIITLLLSILATNASASHVEPVFHEGNLTCGAFGEGVELKIQPVTDGTFSDGDFSITIDVRNEGNLGQVFGWSSPTGGIVNEIFVKGGPDGNLYDYTTTPELETSDTGLHSPVNPKNGRYYGLSHISFCYMPGEPSIAVEKTCTQQSVSGDVVTYVNTVKITNDGDFDMANVTLEETATNLSCDGYPVGQQVAVSNFLAPGESIELEISCTGSDINLDNSVKARGSSADVVVSDSDSSDSSAQCQFAPSPMVNIDKDCPDDNDVRVMAMDNVLVVQVCPTIKVKNTDPQETLSSVVVTDPLIPTLSGGVDVGPLAPGQEVNLADLGYDLCYMPSANEVEQAGFAEGKYAPGGASFLNSASVVAAGKFGGTASASDNTSGECPLCPACPDPEDCPTN